MTVNAYNSEIVPAELADEPRFAWLSHAAALVAGIATSVVIATVLLSYITHSQRREQEVRAAESYRKGLAEGRNEGFAKGRDEGLKIGSEQGRENESKVRLQAFSEGFANGKEEGKTLNREVIEKALDEGIGVGALYATPNWFGLGYLSGRFDEIKYNPSEGEWPKPASNFSPTSAVILFKIGKLSQDHFDWLMSEHTRKRLIECAGFTEDKRGMLFVFVDEDDGNAIGVVRSDSDLARWSIYDRPIPQAVIDKLTRPAPDASKAR